MANTRQSTVSFSLKSEGRIFKDHLGGGQAWSSNEVRSCPPRDEQQFLAGKLTVYL